MKRVLVVDDEQLARQNLTSLLAQCAEPLQIMEARDGNDALKQVAEFLPDIVFLDIEMPGLSGIDVATHIGEKCLVVFVTAYDQYAVNAFELNAIDYLLKPFDDERFMLSWEKILCRSVAHATTDFKQFSTFFEMMMEEREHRYKSRLVVKDPGRIRLLEVAEVNYAQGAGNYVEIHMTDGRKLLHRETMNALANQLNPMEFVRIHRSSIVRISFIKELIPNERGDYCIRLKNDVELSVSRANKHRLLQITQ